MSNHETSTKPYTRKMGPAVVNLDGIDTHVPMIELIDEIMCRISDAVEQLCEDGMKSHKRWLQKNGEDEAMCDWADMVARSMDKRSK